MRNKTAVLSFKAVLRRVREARKKGMTIVTTNGCFDLLHYGHVSYLERAGRLGDMLVVGVNSDATVRRLKGRGRPLNPARVRAAVVAALRAVDAVFIFNAETPVTFLKALKPDIHVKGGDYSGRLLEQDAVEEAGGTVRILPKVPGVSTTLLLRRAKR